ncbi:MAG: acylphosphatase [Deltaproteobacteria bacterium]|nr:MAG: acylphosphatase [Deltaproteobacteria bacterium]
MSETARLHAVIHGRVQGVFFRASARDQAERLGVTGWVRNCPQGTVELVAEGERGQLEQLLQWCHRGPDYARVERVQAEWLPPTGEFASFMITY